jgi:hypothetical protein
MGTVIGMLVVLALVPLAWWRMLKGWQARGALDADLPVPAEPAPEAEDVEGVEGVYVSTVHAGRPLERVVAHGLGTRSTVVVTVDAEGVSLHRGAARSVRIPRADLLGASRQRGQAGKVVAGKEGLVVITWRLGGTELDTAVRCRHRGDAGRLLEQVQAMGEVQA